MARKRPAFFRAVQSFFQAQVTTVRRRPLVFILLALFGLVSSLSLPVLSPQQVIAQTDSASQLVQQGQELYQKGQFSQAVEVLQEAADAYDEVGDTDRKTRSLIDKAQALQALGLYPASCDNLLQAFGFEQLDCQQLPPKIETPAERQTRINAFIEDIKESTDSLDALIKTTGLRLLGDILRQRGDLDLSKNLLELSLASAEKEKSAVLLSLGNTERARGNRIRNQQNLVTEANNFAANDNNQDAEKFAKQPYQEALIYYSNAVNQEASPIINLQAQVNHLSLLLDIKQTWEQATKEAKPQAEAEIDLRPLTRWVEELWPQLELKLTQDAKDLLPDIQSQIEYLPRNRNGVYVRINYARSLMELGRKTDSSLLPDAANILATAVKEAKNLGDKRTESYALGYLGELYEQQGLFAQAENLTQSALKRLGDAQTDDRDIAYRWYWQLGRIRKARGDTAGAIDGYQAAFQTIKDLRRDFIAINRDIQLSDNDVERFYREFVGLLLQPEQSSQANPQPSQANLEIYREIIEEIQLSDIQNFLKKPCSKSKQTLEDFIDKNSPNSAVIYTIIAEDPLEENVRLDILLRLPSDAPSEKLRYYRSQSISKLTFDRDINSLNQTLTEAVVILDTQNLDEQDRTKKLANNKKELLPKLQNMYSLLIKPIEEDRDIKSDWERVKNLVFVLDSRLQNIPVAALHDGKQYLLQSKSVALSIPGIDLVDAKPLNRRNINLLAGGVYTESPANKKRNPLEAVEDELKKIKKEFPGSRILRNDKFTTKKLKKQIKSFSANVIHWANHGEFSSNPEKTFVSTWDDRVNFNEFGKLLGSPELLVLSSCQTATGDSRAFLGLAGVAVRAGAASTLATLWNVEDESAANLMTEFYSELGKPGVTKARALQMAQLELLNDDVYNHNHPVYWAAYVLVGNWL